MMQPLGPWSLYWACRHQGANAYRAGRPLADPYGPDRPFSGRAWRDGSRAAVAETALNCATSSPVSDRIYAEPSIGDIAELIAAGGVGSLLTQFISRGGERRALRAKVREELSSVEELR
jgi:hypothetical protein